MMTTTSDGVPLQRGLVCWDNQLSLVVLTGDHDGHGWWQHVRIGGYGQGLRIDHSDGQRLATAWRDPRGEWHRACDAPTEVRPDLALRRVGPTLWTVVSLDRGARYVRPVEGATVGTWAAAYEQAAAVQATVPDDAVIWYVVAQGCLPEEHQDSDNLLVVSNDGRRSRRVPIRWDAAPRYAVPATADR